MGVWVKQAFMALESIGFYGRKQQVGLLPIPATAAGGPMAATCAGRALLRETVEAGRRQYRARGADGASLAGVAGSRADGCG